MRRFLRAVGASSWSSRAPIFCYHAVNEDADHPLARFGVAPRSLERQLRLLKGLGYRSLTLRELIETFEMGKPTGRAVVLTFDDGYLDTFTTAAPILDALGFRATLFVVTDLVGTTAQWAAGRGGTPPRLATWEQIRALRDRGWEVGLHTATHPDLTTLSEDELTREVLHAMQSLEQQVAVPVRSVAYPYGRYSPAVVRAVKRSGARGAVTVSGCSITTRQSPRYAMPRCSMRRGDGLIDVLFAATVGYRPTALPRIAYRGLAGPSAGLVDDPPTPDYGMRYTRRGDQVLRRQEDGSAVR